MFGFETLNRGNGGFWLARVVCIIKRTISGGLLCNIVESGVLKKTWRVGSHFDTRERGGEEKRVSGDERSFVYKKTMGCAGGELGEGARDKHSPQLGRNGVGNQHSLRGDTRLDSTYND
jgi:hypothetical protein